MTSLQSHDGHMTALQSHDDHMAALFLQQNQGINNVRQSLQSMLAQV